MVLNIFFFFFLYFRIVIVTEFPPCSTNTRMFRSRVVVFRTNFVKNKHLEVDLMYIPTLLFIQYSSIDYLHRTKATLSLSLAARIRGRKCGHKPGRAELEESGRDCP